MAIYHYHRDIGKRAQGKNGVFLAAYIRGEARTCHRINEVVDFSQKENIIYKSCVLPEGAPKWAFDLRHSKIKQEDGSYAIDAEGYTFSEYAWNQLEFVERRKDAQLFFHDNIALPTELSQEEAIALVDSFVKKEIAKEGVFCDVAIHWDEYNPHAHIVMPLRRLTDEGFSNKIRFNQGALTKEVKRVREAWADSTNLKLRECGLDVQIDHRSFKDRGIDLEPTRKVGKAKHMHGYQHQKIAIAENQIIRAQNLERIKQNPEILVTKLSQEHVSFTQDNVKEELDRAAVHHYVTEIVTKNQDNSREKLAADIIAKIDKSKAIFNERELKAEVLASTDSKAEFDEIMAKIEQSSEVLNLGLGSDGRVHYTTERTFGLEKDISKFTELLGSKSTFLVSQSAIEEVVKKYGLNEGQKRALTYITQGKDAALVIGYAGTGKTYMLKAAREVWEKSGFKVHGVALSGAASSMLEKEAGIRSTTNYSFVRKIQNGYLKLGNKDIVVMDEMGMTSLDEMHTIVNAISQGGGKFVGAGDVEQTQSVGRGAPMRAMLEQSGAAVMDEVIRQKAGWQKQATIAFETQNTGEGLDVYNERGCVIFADTEADAKADIANRWTNKVEESNRDVGNSIMVAYKNETVGELNGLARSKLVEIGYLEKSKEFKVAGGFLELAVGDRVLFDRNDYKEINVRNGYFGAVVAIEGRVLTVDVDKKGKVQVDLDKYNHLKYGYAATVHKLQGYTGDNTFEYIDGRGWDRHLMLVGSSRHRNTLAIIADKQTFAGYEDLRGVVSRYGLKDHALEYPVGFSIRRGFEAESTAKRAVNFIRKAREKIYDSWLYLANYQEYVLQQSQREIKKQGEKEAIKNQHLNAVIVADFCDNRIAVAENIGKLDKLEGVEKEKLQQETYQLQLKNGELAQDISQDFKGYKLAMDRNRLGEKDIEKSLEFAAGHTKVKEVIDQYLLQKFYNPMIADEIYSEIKGNYRHIVSILPVKEHSNAFINELRQMAITRRYETAFDKFKDFRAEIKDVKHYCDLNYEIGKTLNIEDRTEQQKDSLHSMSINRDALAYEISSKMDHYDQLLEHFSIDKEWLNKHVARFHDREFVERFSKSKDSTFQEENLEKQVLAHKIKENPKQYGIYVNDFLKDGWKSVNLENWRYERAIKIANSSQEFKTSLRLVREYYATSSLARDAWQGAIKRRDKDSPNYNEHLKRAQAFSYRRDNIASELIGKMEIHAGALAFEKVDLAKLGGRARSCDYLQRYIKESSEIRKIQMAHFIADNLKQYGSGVAVLGIYREIKENARHFDYLRRLQTTPDKSMRDAIRLAENYNQKRINAGIAWGRVRALEKLGANSDKATIEAKHVTGQRNKAAHDFIVGCLDHGLIQPEIKGINVDYDKVNKAANQYISATNVERYLSAAGDDKKAWAYRLLNDKSSYHFIYEKGIEFNELRQASNEWLDGQNIAVNEKPVIEKRELKRWNYEAISEALIANPEKTYTDIFGEPKERSTKELKYSGGLVVSLTGGHAGEWHSFTEGIGGGPIQAIQYQLNMPYKEAIKYGAQIAGLSEMEATYTEQIDVIRSKAAERAKVRKQEELKNQQERIEKARFIWSKAEPISGTLAEKYLQDYRGISDISNMEFKYLPQYKEISPALVLSAYDGKGELVAVQRVFLDAATGSKNKELKRAKLSKGVLSGAGVIQKGKPGGKLYLTEGPETGASVALADGTATVLTSLGVSNLENLADSIKYYNPSEVIIAADNDGKHAITRTKTDEAVNKLQAAGLNTTVAYPEEIKGLDKVDWNDVLVKLGVEEVRRQLGIKGRHEEAELYYHGAKPINYTLAEVYLRQEKGLIDVDLSDLRFHPAAKLPGSEKTAPAIIVPAVNKQGEIKAEQILYLDNAGKKVIGTNVNGEAVNCVIVAQKGDKLTTAYYADNIVDAKSIAVAEKQVNIFVSLKQYDDLSDIAWTIKQLPRNPGTIDLTVDNFQKATEARLFEQTKPLRDIGIKDVGMVRGSLDKQSYTHLGINDALIRAEKIRGKDYIQASGIKEPIQEKVTFKDKLSKAVGLKKELPEVPEVITRPKAKTANDYYLQLSEPQLKNIRGYLDAVAKLEQEDSYKNALSVASKASKVYDSLAIEISDLKKNSQHIYNKEQNIDIEAIKSRVGQGQSLGLNDFAGLLKEVVTPKLDKGTQQQLKALGSLVQGKQQTKEFERAAKKFATDAKGLVNTWQKSKNMPALSYSYFVPDAVKELSEGKISRDSLSRMYKMAEQITASGSTKRSRKLDKEEEWGGGRGGWGY